MKNHFKGKDFLAFMDFNREELEYLTDLGIYLKRKWTLKEPHDFLKGRMWAALFEKHSTRTRNSFERACYDLGMGCTYLRPGEMQTSRGEPLKDTARILDRYYDGLFIRTYGQEIVEEFANWMYHPVINALTSFEHPTQGIADLMTMKEKKGNDLRGLKICLTGDVYNVAQTTMLLGASFGMDVYVAGPKEYTADAAIVAEANRRNAISKGKLMFTADLEEALENADIVYTCTQYSMGQTDEEIAAKIKAHAPYRIDVPELKRTKKDVILMHCLPAHRGQEVTDEALECEYSVVFDEGENRMHSIKSILTAITM